MAGRRPSNYMCNNLICFDYLSSEKNHTTLYTTQGKNLTYDILAQTGVNRRNEPRCMIMPSILS